MGKATSASIVAACGLLLLLAAALPGTAQEVPAAAEGLVEELVSVEIAPGVTQAGVYSVRKGSTAPAILAVLLPGNPSVLRPVVTNGAMTASRLGGNFLVRARRHLASERIALLIADCRSDSGDLCSSRYQASKQRQEDVQRLIEAVRARQPSLGAVWLIGTSLGTVSSAFMAAHGGTLYDGALHTAMITEADKVNEVRDFDFGTIASPQAIIHHRDDPCGATRFSGAQRIAGTFNIPLIVVAGGTGFSGPPCEAYSQHGFRGKEIDVMRLIAAIMTSGRAVAAEIR